MSAEKISRGKFIEWTIQIVILAFYAGTAFFTLKNHETRLIRLEEREERHVLKEDFENRIKSIWEAIR